MAVFKDHSFIFSPCKGWKCGSRKLDFAGYLLRKIHQDEKVSVTHHRAGLLGAVRQLQDLVETGGRAAVFVRTQRDQSGVGQNHGKHGKVPRRGRVFHVRPASWLRRGCSVNSGMSARGSHDSHLLSPGGHRRIHQIRRNPHLIKKEAFFLKNITRIFP